MTEDTGIQSELQSEFIDLDDVRGHVTDLDAQDEADADEGEDDVAGHMASDLSVTDSFSSDLSIAEN